MACCCRALCSCSREPEPDLRASVHVINNHLKGRLKCKFLRRFVDVWLSQSQLPLVLGAGSFEVFWSREYYHPRFSKRRRAI
jgi:hypothetical protein